MSFPFATKEESPECLVPSAFDTTRRQQSAKVGVFNLISTMIGGGVLSLPYAVSRCGLVLGFFFLFLSGVVSAFSFDILVSCSRRTGAITYQQIGYVTYGHSISVFITILIFLTCAIASIAYCILCGDLFVPIACSLLSSSNADSPAPAELCADPWLRRFIILGCILLISPFCYMRKTTALQFTSFGSIVAVMFLAAIITYTSAQTFMMDHFIYYTDANGATKSYYLQIQPQTQALTQTQSGFNSEAVGSFSQSYSYSWTNDIGNGNSDGSSNQLWHLLHFFPQSATDAIYVFPVFGVAFLCHFNIPYVHSEMKRPTRKRIRMVFMCVVAFSVALYSIIAFFGYFYSFTYVCGDVLLNFDQSSVLVSIARGCLGFVILCSFPLLILPARKALHNLLNLAFNKEQTQPNRTQKERRLSIVDEQAHKEQSKQREGTATTTTTTTTDTDADANENIKDNANDRKLQNVLRKSNRSLMNLAFPADEEEDEEEDEEYEEDDDGDDSNDNDDNDSDSEATDSVQTESDFNSDPESNSNSDSDTDADTDADMHESYNEENMHGTNNNGHRNGTGIENGHGNGKRIMDIAEVANALKIHIAASENADGNAHKSKRRRRGRKGNREALTERDRLLSSPAHRQQSLTQTPSYTYSSIVSHNRHHDVTQKKKTKKKKKKKKTQTQKHKLRITTAMTKSYSNLSSPLLGPSDALAVMHGNTNTVTVTAAAAVAVVDDDDEDAGGDEGRDADNVSAAAAGSVPAAANARTRVGGDGLVIAQREASVSVSVMQQRIKEVIQQTFDESNMKLQESIDYQPSLLFLVIETTILILIPIAISWMTSSVMVVWSIMGSTVTFLIAFTFPAAFYIKIRKHKGMTVRNCCAALLCASSFGLMWLCMWQAFSRLNVPPCTNMPPQT